MSKSGRRLAWAAALVCATPLTWLVGGWLGLDLRWIVTAAVLSASLLGLV